MQRNKRNARRWRAAAAAAAVVAVATVGAPAAMADGQFYFTNFDRFLGTANLDGSSGVGSTTLSASTNMLLEGIAVDAQHIYYADSPLSSGGGSVAESDLAGNFFNPNLVSLPALGGRRGGERSRRLLGDPRDPHDRPRQPRRKRSEQQLHHAPKLRLSGLAGG
jgi:hypothetical protein